MSNIDFNLVPVQIRQMAEEILKPNNRRDVRANYCNTLTAIRDYANKVLKEYHSGDKSAFLGTEAGKGLQAQQKADRERQKRVDDFDRRQKVKP